MKEQYWKQYFLFVFRVALFCIVKKSLYGMFFRCNRNCIMFLNKPNKKNGIQERKASSENV